MKRSNLKDFRLKRHLTQFDMAGRLGVSVSHYKNIELGKKDPSYNLMKRFEKEFTRYTIDENFIIKELSPFGRPKVWEIFSTDEEVSKNK